MTTTEVLDLLIVLLACVGMVVTFIIVVHKTLEYAKISLREETVKVTYHSKAIDKLEYIDGKSDWIDLRSAEDVSLKKGEFTLIDLGVSISLPDGYELIIAPRSSTFKKYGILQANSIGVVDESYGKTSDRDVLMMPVYATKDTEIHTNDRICQFRIQRHQPRLIFKELEVGELDGTARDGFGSTGTN